MSAMVYGSVCSGIEAASAAWKPLGWRCRFVAEIEAYCVQYLKQRYPKIPNLGNILDRAFIAKALRLGRIGVLVGGTPCQAFSVAGLGGSLDDPRGQLTLRFVQLVHALKARWAVWENVPGVLSQKDNAFGCFLAGMVGSLVPLTVSGGGRSVRSGSWPCAGLVSGPRGSLAWRVLDAQYFGLAQRRARVFAVFRAGTGLHPAAVLFEPEGVRGDIAPGRKAREDIARSIRAQSQSSLRDSDTFIPDVSYALGAGAGGSKFVAHTLRAEGADASEDGTGRGVPLVCGALTPGAHPGGYNGQDAYNGKLISVDYTNGNLGEIAGTIEAAQARGNRGQGVMAVHTRQDPCVSDIAFAHDATRPPANGVLEIPFDPRQITSKQHGVMAFTERKRDGGRQLEAQSDLMYALTNPNDGGRTSSRQVLDTQARVRRLTPRECERLQGFPDDATLIKGKPGKLEADYVAYLQKTTGWSKRKCSELVADAPRYRALGNSMARPVMEWIGRRIEMVERATA